MSSGKKYQRPKTCTKAGWKLTIVEVLTKLRQSGVYDYIEEAIENNDENAAVFVIRHNRFYRECVTLNRISISNYHVNFGAEHYRRRTAKETAKVIHDIILRELPSEEGVENEVRNMRKPGYNRR